MTPLFCELEELGKESAAAAGVENNEEDSSNTLDIEEFIDALGRLYE